MTAERQRGFTLLEALVVVAIILIVSAIAAPRMFQIIDAQKLQSSAQSYAGLLQVARTRAIQDNQVYQVLSAVNAGAAVAYVDLNGNSQWDPQGVNGSAPEPAVQMPTPIDITQTNAPQGVQGFDTIRPLNIVPLNLATNPPMVNSGGLPSPGIAFNERGLPCQRTVAGAACNNVYTVIVPGNPPQVTAVAWVTYLRWTRRSGNGFDWGAVSVSPAGRIRTWRYQINGANGSWQ